MVRLQRFLARAGVASRRRAEELIAEGGVLVNGKVVKYDHRLLGIDLARAKQAVMESVEYTRGHMGEQAWNAAMNPEKAVVEVYDNPYTYTDSARARAAQKHANPGL